MIPLRVPSTFWKMEEKENFKNGKSPIGIGIGSTSHIPFEDRSSAKKREFRLPLALAIILFGQNEDDLDNCKDVIYIGQGGNNLLCNKCQIWGQVME